MARNLLYPHYRMPRLLFWNRSRKGHQLRPFDSSGKSFLLPPPMQKRVDAQRLRLVALASVSVSQAEKVLEDWDLILRSFGA